MKHFLCCALILLLQATAFGQDSPAVAGMQKGTPQNDRVKSEVSRLLESTVNRDRAWAAYLIGKYDLKEMAAQLYPLLNPELSGQQDEIEFVHRAALDSLIQLGVTPPGDKLMPLYNKLPDEVLILFARAPYENQQALLPIAQQSKRTIYWLAACNLLAGTKAPGFAAGLIKEMKIEVRITVSDPRNGGIGMSIGSGGFSAGDGIFSVPDGFPPTAVYSLKKYASYGEIVATPGPHQIYYERHVAQPGVSGQIGVGSVDDTSSRDPYRLEYLAALLKTTVEDLKVELSPFHLITWQGSDKYRREIEQPNKR